MSWFAIDWNDDGADIYPGGVILRDATGRIVRVTLGPGDVDCRPYYKADYNDWIVKAIVASEDGTFFEHSGVRPMSIARAAWQNVTSRRRISGASTITMQTVRLIKPHKKTYAAKWVEAFQALKMERSKDKLWILSQYLNRAPFGANFVGIEAAANGWFGKEAKSLTLCEAALLAGMVQAPSRFRPDRGYEKALKRRNYVLGRMEELGFISKAQADAARSVVPKLKSVPRPFLYPHYCDYYLREMTKNNLAFQLKGEYVIPIDLRIQEIAQSIVNSASADGGPATAIVVRRVDSGEVVALAVSGDYFSPNAGQVNTALAVRSAGSTLKPFLAALAMDNGIICPTERLVDLPKYYKGYNPSNYDLRCRGLVTLNDALILSLNIPFVQLLEKVNITNFALTLRTLGFEHMASNDQMLGLGMAIGNVEVTLDELTKAYVQFARAAKGKDNTVFSKESAYLVSQALSSFERSFDALGHVADVQLPRFAWKTGTSSANRDAWTVAWNPEYVVGVWRGHISGKIGESTFVGVKTAAPLAWRMVRSIYYSNDTPWFEKPERVYTRKVCTLSGKQASVDCPHQEDGVAIKDVSSVALCSMHRRDFEGQVIEVLPPALEAFMNKATKAREVKIVSPINGATFKYIPGMTQQKIVFKVSGNPSGEKLWWFHNGLPAGQTEGGKSFVLDMQLGKHNIMCTSAHGVSASINVEVK